MNHDLEQLLDLQEKDLALLDVDQRLDEVLQEEQGLDEAVRRAEAAVGVAQRGVAESIRRRSEGGGMGENERKV